MSYPNFFFWWICHPPTKTQNVKQFVFFMSILRDCPLAAQVRYHLLPFQNRNNFYTTDLPDWVKLNLEQKDWAGTWAQAAYYLWLWRNQQVHNVSFIIRPFRHWEVISHHCRMYKDLSKQIELDQLINKKWKFWLIGNRKVLVG